MLPALNWLYCFRNANGANDAEALIVYSPPIILPALKNQLVALAKSPFDILLGPNLPDNLSKVLASNP